MQRFEAPVEMPGWSERPWVEVRALTEAEALERESLGLLEEYELVARGLEEPELRVRRVYDLVAMAEYEWGKCLVDWCLPAITPGGDGETLTPGPSPTGRGENGGPQTINDETGTEVPVWEGASLRDAGNSETAFVARRRTGDGEGDLEFLRAMGACLGAWLKDVLDRVNWRLPEQRARVEIAKKN